MHDLTENGSIWPTYAEVRGKLVYVHIHLYVCVCSMYVCVCVCVYVCLHVVCVCVCVCENDATTQVRGLLEKYPTFFFYSNT